VTQKAIDATQTAVAVMTALLDGTEGGNWDAAQSVVTDYTSDDAANADLMAGLINLGMVLVTQIKQITGESTDTVLSTASQVVVIAGMDDSG
jgi:hypothetical protein